MTWIEAYETKHQSYLDTLQINQHLMMYKFSICYTPKITIINVQETRNTAIHFLTKSRFPMPATMKTETTGIYMT